MHSKSKQDRRTRQGDFQSIDPPLGVVSVVSLIMGVTGLWSLLEPAGKPVKLESLENHVLAVGEDKIILIFNE